jgi:hypothetical protein
MRIRISVRITGGRQTLKEMAIGGKKRGSQVSTRGKVEERQPNEYKRKGRRGTAKWLQEER